MNRTEGRGFRAVVNLHNLDQKNRTKEASSLRGKSILLLVVLITALALSGCSGGSKQPVDVVGKTPPITSNDPKGQTGKSDQKVELPKEFPADLIPFLGDAKIDHVMKNGANKAINITYSTGNSREDAFAFYQDVMKEGSSVQEIVTEDSHIIIGGLGDHVVSITIMSNKGVTLVNIDTRPE